MPSRNLPSKRSPSSKARKSWKSSSLPLCGVAVSSRKFRVRPESSCPSLYRLVVLHFARKEGADILWASSQTTRSQSDCSSLAWSVSSRLSLSRRQITREFSWNQLPVRADSSLSFVMISNGKWKRRSSSSCHCSARLPGQTIMQRCRSPRTITSLMSSPVMIVLPAPGIVGQQVAERLAGQHFAVDGRNLVRQRLDHRSVDGQQRIEEVGQPDSLGLGNQPEKRTIAVETPRAALGDDFDGGLAVAVKQARCRPSRGVLVREIDGDVADPLDVHNRDELVGKDALDGGPASQIFQFRHASRPHLASQHRGCRTPAASYPAGLRFFMTVFSSRNVSKRCVWPFAAGDG